MQAHRMALTSTLPIPVFTASIPPTAPIFAAVQDSILVIDDNVRDVRLLSEMLRPEGYRVFAALSGEEGFKRALAHPPALLLLDLTMPGLDGRATCRLFKGTPQLSAVPVIFLTGSDMLDDKLSAFSLGAVDYITKPFSAQEVAARLRIHLRLWTGQPGTVLGNRPVHVPGAAPAESEPPRPSAGERIVRDAQALLLRDLSASLSLPDLAHAVGTNERRLTGEFRRYTGMAVFEYLRQERYRQACALLLHSGQTVGRIAEAVGFQSVAAFSFAFRKFCGLSPNQYRQSAGLTPSPGDGGDEDA